MKKILLVIQLMILSFTAWNLPVFAETYEYPFDEISIISATMFQIEVSSAIDSQSILYGQAEVGEILNVYIGELKFICEGVAMESTSSIIIVSTQDDVDILAWIINNSNSDIDTYETKGYASWILIDPEIGVVKDLTLTQMEVSITHYFETNVYLFEDNINTQYQMISGSLLEEDDLNIVISAYVEVTE